MLAQLLSKGKDEDGSDVAGGAGYSSGVATVLLRYKRFRTDIL